MEIKRKITIHWKYNPTTFEIINREVIGEQVRKIGSSISAVNALLSKPAMLRHLMPIILGVSPDSRDVNWDARVKHYWDSLSVDVPSGGRMLETGLSFDIKDLSRKEYIAPLAESKKLDSSKQLAEYVMGFKGDEPNVPEDEKWKYATPLVIEDYLLWRYIVNYKHVANKAEDANKSPNIRFYLHTQEEAERVKKQQFKTKQEALTKYMKFMEKATIEDVNDVLSVLTPSSIKEIVSNTDLEEKQMLIMEVVSNNPTKFVDVIKDTNLKIKAQVEKFLAYSVLKQLPGSTVIVESADPSVVLGNTMDETISYISNEKNKVKVDELLAKYKSLITK